MAIVKQRLHKKTTSGHYDIIHLETSADLLVGAVPIANGGTGATTAAAARTNLGITLNNLGAAPASHTHTTSQITGLQAYIESLIGSAIGSGGGGTGWRNLHVERRCKQHPIRVGVM